MLPRRPEKNTRRPEINIANKVNKPPSLKPASLLSFGIRTLPKENHTSRNTKIVNDKPQPQMVQTSQKRREQCNNSLLLNDCNGHLSQNCTGNHQQMQIQNLVFKEYQSNHKPFLIDYNIQQRTFSDQIGGKSNILKLSDITNIYPDQAQDHTNIHKKLPSWLNTCEFLQDRAFKQLNQTQTLRIYVDMKKKIKKLSKSKRFPQLQANTASAEELKTSISSNGRMEMTALHQNLMKAAYADNEVIQNDSIFRCQLINQKIDNDVDTDEEQIASGIKRLQKSLEQAVQQCKRQAIQASQLMQDCQLDLGSLDKQSCYIERQLC